MTEKGFTKERRAATIALVEQLYYQMPNLQEVP